MSRFLILVSLVIALCFLSALSFTARISGEPLQVEKSGKEVVRIFVYDPVRGFLNWPQPWFRSAVRSQCSTACHLIDDRKHIKEADVVLFHAPTHGKGGPIPDRKVFGSNVVYAFLSMEQPKYAKILANPGYLTKNFDLMITYSRRTQYPGTIIPNMPITYWPLNVVAPEYILQPRKPSSEKTGYDTGVTIAAFVSNCKAAGAEVRAKYLRDLMELIPVHSYGGCLKNRDEPPMPDDPAWPSIAQKRSRKIRVLSNYKFYFAFENSQVEDYVSEKIFESLLAGTVPIYRGASGIAKFMPDGGSFIDANNMSPKEVADLVKSLNNDEDKYESYFAFKKKPLTEEFQQIALNSYTHPNVACRLCEYAQILRSGDKAKNGIYGDMSFGTSNLTNPHLRFIRHDWSERFASAQPQVKNGKKGKPQSNDTYQIAHESEVQEVQKRPYLHAWD